MPKAFLPYAPIFSPTLPEGRVGIKGEGVKGETRNPKLEIRNNAPMTKCSNAKNPSTSVVSFGSLEF
jgi:hypothetical protein